MLKYLLAVAVAVSMLAVDARAQVGEILQDDYWYYLPQKKTIGATDTNPMGKEHSAQFHVQKIVLYSDKEVVIPQIFGGFACKKPLLAKDSIRVSFDGSEFVKYPVFVKGKNVLFDDTNDKGHALLFRRMRNSSIMLAEIPGCRWAYFPLMGFRKAYARLNPLPPSDSW